MGTKANPDEFDCYDKAADDEPMFVLRAKDPLAPILVRLWADLRGQVTPHNTLKIQSARQCAVDMQEYHDRLAR